MLPVEAATTTLANIAPTSNAVLPAFLPYGYMEIGIGIAVIMILFIIYVFGNAIKSLLFGIGDHPGMYSRNVQTGRWEKTKFQ